MSAPEHGIAAKAFELLISLELVSMNLEDHVDLLGSTTVTIGSWKKEADFCWAPASKATALSFVVEVGLSESARNLPLDARGWLETCTSSVKLVVTIGINRANPEVILHRWELCPENIVSLQDLPLSQPVALQPLNYLGRTTQHWLPENPT
ncbi:uncharacterized protein BDW43DRAFT_310558 [Aspergillus alliaceus]|uniref:uncharacterized protein n=1 Tax=Petromyces alliaceus TaxID=209559 RepID=UPI0012A43DC1|nr:uncharacterized protein BDW43DRAFT_310558 [Aspergillus alliaceus]KAB8234202.1 hypothetical protein BDW43DRAFT_310558 [Aspergillus alliaceus]